MLGLKRKKTEMTAPDEAMPGRTDREMRVAPAPNLLGHQQKRPWT